MVATTTALAATVVTLTLFAALGTWYARGRIGGVEDYITARNSTGGGMLAATLFASSMGAWVLLSPAEAGAAFGGVAAVVGYAVGSAVPLLAFAVLGPRIRDLMPEGHSLTEYAHARYGSAMYAYVLLVSVAYMFVYLAAEFTGIVGALAYVAGVPTWQTAGLLALFVLAYTGYGGLRASIFTDTVQTALVLPLVAVAVVVVALALGGPGEAYRAVAATHPTLVDPGYLPGVKFGVYVVVAVLGAEMLNQSWWQRIYAASTDRALRRGFLVAAVAVVPMVVLPGLFGVAAAGLGYASAGEASISFFVLVAETVPDWAALVVVLVALLLVMSTADTLFNALASVVTADLPRVASVGGDDLLLAARGFTAVAALGAAVVGAQGYSVLTLFFVADLLATATFVPLLVGLYSERTTEAGALVASLAGLVVGGAFFPPFGLLAGASYFRAFLGAALVSTLATAAATAAADAGFDHAELARVVRRLD